MLRKNMLSKKVQNNICVRPYPILSQHWTVISADLQEPPELCWQFAQLEPYMDFVKLAIESGSLQPDPLIPVQLEPSARIAELARQRFLKGHN